MSFPKIYLCTIYIVLCFAKRLCRYVDLFDIDVWRHTSRTAVEIGSEVFPIFGRDAVNPVTQDIAHNRMMTQGNRTWGRFKASHMYQILGNQRHFPERFWTSSLRTTGPPVRRIGANPFTQPWVHLPVPMTPPGPAGRKGDGYLTKKSSIWIPRRCERHLPPPFGN